MNFGQWIMNLLVKENKPQAIPSYRLADLTEDELMVMYYALDEYLHKGFAASENSTGVGLEMIRKGVTLAVHLRDEVMATLTMNRDRDHF